MGKRKHRKTDEEIRRKIRRLERRLEKRMETEDSEQESECEYLISPDRSVQSVVRVPFDTETTGSDLMNVCAPPEPLTNNSSTSTSQGEKDAVPITVEPISSLPNDILEALGTSKNKVEIFAPKIRDEISERWGQIIVDGLSKECTQKLMENIHIPENFTLLKAPVLNPELASVLTDTVKNRDKRLEKAQNHLGQCIAAIANLTSSLIDGDLEKTDVIKKVSEVGQLLLDLHCQNTYARRKLVSYSLDKKFIPIIQGSKRDSFLFGDNLGEKIKANKMAERSGLQIKFKKAYDSQPSTSSYQQNQHPPNRQGNSRGPPKSQRGRKGGPRNFEPAQAHKRSRTTTTHTDRNKPSRQNYRN